MMSIIRIPSPDLHQPLLVTTVTTPPLGYKGGEQASSPTTWCYIVNMRGLSLVSDKHKTFNVI